MEWIIITLILGFVLIGAEVYIPGGILGTFGGISLLVSLFLVFTTYGTTAGLYYFFALIILAGISIFLAVKLVPRSRLASSFFLKNSETGYSSTSRDLGDLKGKEGVTITFLRPSGKARIDGRRIDVVTEGGLIEKDRKIKVIEVAGSRVVVREIEG